MASSALSQDVKFNYDNKADFSQFKTYKWVAFKNAAPIDNLTDEQIRSTVDAALAKKGLTKVDGDNTADLLIDYQSSELIDQTFPKAATSGEKPWTIYSGDLAIDMYTPAHHNLVWRGVANKTLDPNAKPEKRQKNLEKAVAKMMKNYPPPK
jgi:hypothetical protein